MPELTPEQSRDPVARRAYLDQVAATMRSIALGMTCEQFKAFNARIVEMSETGDLVELLVARFANYGIMTAAVDAATLFEELHPDRKDQS